MLKALSEGEEITILKQKGKVSDLEDYSSDKNIKGTIGIGHTRCTTHGVPNQKNAHPHSSGDRNSAIIHNGIIENYDSIKRMLSDKGHTFKSDTDTEILIHLIEEIKNHENCSLFVKARLSLNEVIGIRYSSNGERK